MTGSIGLVQVSFIWLLLVTFGAYLLMDHHRLGNHIYAVGGNRDAATAIGVNVPRVKLSAFVIAGGAAALSGIISTVRVSSVSPIHSVSAESQPYATTAPSRRAAKHRHPRARRRATRSPSGPMTDATSAAVSSVTSLISTGSPAEGGPARRRSAAHRVLRIRRGRKRGAPFRSLRGRLRPSRPGTCRSASAPPPVGRQS